MTLTPGLLGVGRLLTMDSLLTLWVTLSLLAAFEATRTPHLKRGWWLLAATASGLGLLSKGPITLVLVLPPIWLHHRLTDTGASLRGKNLLVFLGISLAVASPWYIALCFAHPEFAKYFFWEHNVVRFLQPFDHIEPFWFYLPLLAVALLPATSLLIPFARYLGSGEHSTSQSRSPEFGFTLLSGLWCVLFFSLSGCKLPTYILPALPFLALAMGHFLTHSEWRESRSVQMLAVTGLAMQLLTHFIIVPWYAEYRSPLRQWAAIHEQCGDPDTPVICYPRMRHSVAFYLGREEMTWFRSKEIDQFRQAPRENPKTVVLLSHRHSLTALGQVLPPEFEIRQAADFGLPPVPLVPQELGKKLAKTFGETALGLADLAVVEPMHSRPMEARTKGTLRN